MEASEEEELIVVDGATHESRGGEEESSASRGGLDRAMDQFPREDDAAKWRRNNVIVRVDRRLPREIWTADAFFGRNRGQL